MGYFALMLFFQLMIFIRQGSTATDKCSFIYYQVAFRQYVNCSAVKVCNKIFDIIRVDMPPYSDHDIAGGMLDNCCSPCYKNRSNLLDVRTIEPWILNVGHFSYPFLASWNAKTLYGYHFIPVVQAPNFYYITRKNVGALEQLIMSTLKLYPLLIICLLLAVISGFIAWILETWFNEKEFPRPFLIGWFEGFWWSFISMTTVGYGDKTPKSIAARVFSVFWIVMGVAMFGIVTGEMTNALMNANMPPDPEVYGATVGLLKYREYDAHYVAEHGGVIQYAGREIEDHFKTDILWLSRQLRLNNIDGILLDKHTFAYALDYFQEKLMHFNASQSQDVRFILHDTVRTAKVYEGEKLAYGILVREKEDYEYFRHAFADNRLPLFTTKALKWNRRDESTGREEKLFDSSATLFKDGIAVIMGCIGVILLFGIAYETRRRGCPIFGRPVGTTQSPNSLGMN